MAETSEDKTFISGEESFKEKENDYLKLVNKKIRTLSKKLNINITYIENKVASGAKINEDEQKVLASKPYLLKSLKDFEELKAQIQKINDQEEKVQKRTKRKGDSDAKHDEKPQIQPLIKLLQVCDFFDKSRPEGIESRKSFLSYQENQRVQEGKVNLVHSESDIDSFFQLSHLIQSYAVRGDVAVEHATKLIGESEDEVFSGKTYKDLWLQTVEVISSPIFNQQSLPRKIQEVVPQESTEVPADLNHIADINVPNHLSEQKEETIEETQPAETEESEVEQPTETSEEVKEKDLKPVYRRRGGRGRGRSSNFGNQEAGSPKEGNFNRDRRERGGNRRGGSGNRGSNRGGNRGGPNNQKPTQQTPAQS